MSMEVPRAVPISAASGGPRLTRELFRYWGTVGVWMAVISTLSTDAFSAANTGRYIDPVLRFFFRELSNEEILGLHALIRKSAHVTEFFVLGLLLFWAARRGRMPRWCVRWTVLALVIAAAYALFDEFHQLFVPSRTPSLIDSGIDFSGATLSQAVVYLRFLWLRSRHRAQRRLRA
jgi:VanZ family protein